MGKAPSITMYMRSKTCWNNKKASAFKQYLRMDDLPAYKDKVSRFDAFLQFRSKGQTEDQAIISVFNLEDKKVR